MAQKSPKAPDATNVQPVGQMSLNQSVKRSLHTIDSMLSNDSTPAATRLGAARTVLELAGLLGAGRRNGADREPHEMSDGELRRAINGLQAKLADRATPVSSASTDDVIDMIG